MAMQLSELRRFQYDPSIILEKTEQGWSGGGYLIRPFELRNGHQNWAVVLAGKYEMNLGFFNTVDEAKRDLVDRIIDDREQALIGRGYIKPVHAHTPWGAPQQCRRYSDEVLFYSTASHGGFVVLAEKKMPEALLAAGGWYEEDVCAARVALGFPELFTIREKRLAEETLRNWEPAIWEEFFGQKLKPGESQERDCETFRLENSDNFVVISASTEGAAWVKAFATRGGRREENAEERVFLIAMDEYRARGPFGFVIDLAKHQEIATTPKEAPTGFQNGR